MRSVPIWDLPTRVFHWALAVAVALTIFIEAEAGAAFLVHAVAGYLAILLIAYRLVWGFVGSPRSRFADFIYGWASVRAYAGRLLRLAPPRHIGHNPLGGWMVVALLAVTLAAAVSGLFSGEDGAAGPFVGVVGGEGLGELHETLGNLLIVLVVLHLFGVAADIALTRENLIRPMISGRKEMDDAAAAAEPPLAGGRRGAALALVVALVGGYFYARWDPTVAAIGQGEEREDGDEDDD
ncbi:MAG: cytochrome b/b6 domain-containing protein [Dongiaceae bacterium]